MSSNVIAVAGSRGRTSMVAVEVIENAGRSRPTKLVRYADSFPATAGPADIARKVVSLAERVRAEKDAGYQPRLVVSAAVHGGAVLDLLREARESGIVLADGSRAHIHERPLGITTYASAATQALRHLSPNVLASTLFREYDSGRLEFAPRLDKLRSQMSAFVPVESKVGNIAFGNEDMSDYDDLVVALMHAIAGTWTSPRFGIPRYRDQSGFTWPSRAMALARAGQGAR